MSSMTHIIKQYIQYNEISIPMIDSDWNEQANQSNKHLGLSRTS